MEGQYPKIAVDELIDLLDEYISDNKIQSRPAILWIDKPTFTLLNHTGSNPTDITGFALNLAALSNNRIAFWDKAGSPLTDHKYISDNGVVRLITEEERYTFCLPSVIKKSNDGELITKVFIHTPLACTIGDEGITSIQYGVMIHEKLSIAVFLFFPLSWKESIYADLSAYDQFLCSTPIEKVISQWLKRVSEKNANGFQLVDNFYLDFLKQNPEYLRQVHPDDWERASQQIISNVRNLLITNDDKLFPDGNLDFNALGDYLDKLPDEHWLRWFNSQSFDIHTKQPNRLNIFKYILCDLWNIVGINRPKIEEALHKYHNILP